MHGFSLCVFVYTVLSHLWTLLLYVGATQIQNGPISNQQRPCFPLRSHSEVLCGREVPERLLLVCYFPLLSLPPYPTPPHPCEPLLWKYVPYKSATDEHSMQSLSQTPWWAVDIIVIISMKRNSMDSKEHGPGSPLPPTPHKRKYRGYCVDGETTHKAWTLNL